MQMFAQLDKWENLLSFRNCSHWTAYIFHHLPCKKLCQHGPKIGCWPYTFRALPVPLLEPSVPVHATTQGHRTGQELSTWSEMAEVLFQPNPLQCGDPRTKVVCNLSCPTDLWAKPPALGWGRVVPPGWISISACWWEQPQLPTEGPVCRGCTWPDKPWDPAKIKWVMHSPLLYPDSSWVLQTPSDLCQVCSSAHGACCSQPARGADFVLGPISGKVCLGSLFCMGTFKWSV